MGQRGPAPEPARLRILKGETRPSQLKGSPAPQKAPLKPSDMRPDAAAVWDRVLKATARTAHIGQPHAETFRQYCEVTAAMNEMQPKGSKEWRELANIHRQLARELCLTPATGNNLTSKTPAVDPLADFLAG